MKCLKIKSGQGYFSDINGKDIAIDKISKDDILRFVDIITMSEEPIEIDDMNSNQIDNEAHKIIYMNLSEKLNELLSQRKRFVDESKSEYKEALEKYSK